MAFDTLLCLIGDIRRIARWHKLAHGVDYLGSFDTLDAEDPIIGWYPDILP
jgi:hypothetical protein